MTARRLISRLQRAAADFRGESGATIVELAIVLAVFLLIFFGLLDFGRLGFNAVLAQKATQTAARIAVVRPPLCGGLPATNQRADPGDTSTPLGTDCAGGVCVAVADARCSLATAVNEDTADEIWNRIRPLLPGNATRAAIEVTYSYDPAMNFLGGPYVPLVTVEITGLQFDFVSPLGGLAALANGGDPGNLGDSFLFPGFSVSLPGEDLRHGMMP